MTPHIATFVWLVVGLISTTRHKLPIMGYTIRGHEILIDFRNLL